MTWQWRIVGLMTWVDVWVGKAIYKILLFFGFLHQCSELSAGILVIRLDHKIGDMVCFSDFLKQLRQNYPQKNITLILHSSMTGLYAACPYVDEQISFEWGRSLPLSLIGRLGRVILFIRRAHVCRNWDLAISSRFDEDFYAPFVAYMSGARERIGFQSSSTPRKQALMLGSDSLFTRTILAGTVCHEVHNNLHILREVIHSATLLREPQLETWVMPDDSISAEEILRTAGVDSTKPMIGIGFGAYDAKRVWPGERYAELIDVISARYGQRHLQFLLLGTAKESPSGDYLVSKLGSNAKVFNLAGLTTIGQCASVVSKTKLFIGNDSGLLHLAAASGCSCIEISCHPVTGDLSHSNSPLRFGPFCKNAWVLQPERSVAPCTDCCREKVAHCIREVQVDSVINAVQSYLDANFTVSAQRDAL